MWWIKARAKWLIAVLVIVAGAGGAAFYFTQNTTDGKLGTDGGTGVRVYQDDQGRVIVANANELKPELPFALPRNCDEAFALMKDMAKKYGNQAKATPDVRQVHEIYDNLAKQLCSYARYNSANLDWLKEWYYNPDTWIQSGQNPQNPQSPDAGTTVPGTTSPETRATESTTTTTGTEPSQG